MASKTFELDNVGNVTVVKRRSNRHLRLTIATGGQIRVSIPTWAPYQAGLDFAIAKQNWIAQKRPVAQLITNGQAIGRAHHIKFKQVDNLDHVKSRVTDGLITVSYPAFMVPEETIVQQAAQTAATKALRVQAEHLLPVRLNTLANTYNLPFKDVRIKRLSRRWGSCDQDKRIVLNLYLIQLPWELIDYVLLHELTHTKHLNHGQDFWEMLESMAPNARQLKKSIGSYHPAVISL